MNEFDIYTLGSGYYLEKIFNAIRLIIDGKDSFVSIIKFASIAAIVVLAIRAGINNDLKSAAKWFLGVTVLVGLFLTSRATIHIHDKLPDSYGIMQAPRTVQNVPWGLAVIGSTTSQVGNFLAEKFDMAFAATFVNSSYQETGMLFGSKIIEDVSKLRIQDPNLKTFVAKFYKRCVVPDLRMGLNRVNGYTVKDLVDAEDLLTFLKDHSSKARVISNDNDYLSCNQAAHNIAASLNSEIDRRKPKLVNSFLSYFFPDKQTGDSNQLFESILTSSYGIFIRNSSKDAKDLLLQNVMINSLSDKSGSYSRSFGKVTTEETTAAAYYSIAQMAQKFVPIYRAVLECILYGVFPLILVLMVTPIGLEVLKNYSFGFIYLQMWQPMYAILFCIAGAWGKYYASGIDGGVTFANHMKIAHINSEISAIAGYMLASIPILSVFITKGMVSSMGNLASSVFYVQQSAAVQNAEQAIRGNYQVGTTQIDTHSFNTTTGNKFDDSHAWQSGMKSFSMASGAMEKQFTDGRTGIDSSGAVSNLANQVNVDWSQVAGSRHDKLISDQRSQAEQHSVSSAESATAGYSKLFGFDKNFSQGSNAYESWSKNLTTDQRESLDEARSFVSKFAETHGISQQDALKIAIAGNLGGSIGGAIGKLGINLGIDASSSASKSENANKILEAAKDSKFAESLSKIQNFATSDSYQENSSINNSMMQSARSDFNHSKTASIQASHAMDKVHNLQESKASYEQNSASISLNYSNRFAEDEIGKYGVAGFEQKLRNDPKTIQRDADQFVDRNINTGSNEVIQDYSEQKADFNNNQYGRLKKKHEQHLNSVNDTNESDKALVTDAAPKDFEKNITNNIANSHTKDSVNEHLKNSDQQIEQKRHEFNNQADSLEKKVFDKNEKTATRTMIDKIKNKGDES